MIHLRTLGALELHGPDGRELDAVLAQSKRTALLVYLALARPRGFHRRDTLLALFWPEQDAERGRNALSQAVHFLRRSLGEGALVTRNVDELSLARDRVWCDVVAFEEALDAGQREQAIALYRGDLLEGFHVAEAPEFARWLEGERARLGDRLAKALEAVAEQREAAGDVGEAVAQWRRLAARDPYSSRVALRFMRALAAAGDPAGAVRHARVHETLLREELGVAPDPEVAALVAELQSIRAAPRSAGPTLPPGTPVVTRAASPSRPAPRRPRTAFVLAAVVAFLAVGVGAVVWKNAARERATIRSFAVLPFEDLSGDSARQAFVDGMHDVLITELGRYPDLTVISRASTVRYKGTTKRPPEIARELKVDGVIGGTVLRHNGRVRMTVQLVHGPSDRQLWARRYERDLRDVLLLQGELAEAIAREVHVATAPRHRARRTAGGAADSLPRELYLRELYLRGRHAELSRSPIGIQTAREAYRRAIDVDSTFALGYAGLAAMYGFMADYDYAPVGPALDSARLMALRAVALDSTLADTRTALAVTLGDAGQFPAAERQLLRAIELEPSNARAHYWYSILLVALGRGEEALREAQRAATLDPFAPRGLLAMQRYAVYLITGERPHLRLPVAERRSILKLEPGEPWARGYDALEYAEEGRCHEARSELDLAQRLASESRRMLYFVASVYWLCGERARARAVVEEMKHRPDASDHGYWIALPYAVFGERDSAFAWLGRHRWTMASLSGLSADRGLDRLRSDPRYARLLRRLGIRKS